MDTKPGRRHLATRQPASRHQRWLVVGLVLVLVVYLALTVAVVVGSPLDTLDQDALHWNLQQRFPSLEPWVSGYVVLGQRGPGIIVALPWLLWRSWRLRSVRPVVMLTVALVLLNVSVGVVKELTGRLGPQVTDQTRAVFDGGNIFPSGHTSNAVVLFGVVAWTAINHRRLGVALAAILSVTVGLSTVYLDTHWTTDVLGGWLAGALVLLVLPLLMPLLMPRAERAARRGLAWARSRRHRAAAQLPAGSLPAGSLRGGALRSASADGVDLEPDPVATVPGQQVVAVQIAHTAVAFGRQRPAAAVEEPELAHTS